MTRSNLRTEIRRLLNDTNSVRFGDAQLNTWLDIANSDAIARLGPFDTAQATIATVSGEPNYSFPTSPNNVIAVKEIYLQNANSKETRLDIVTQDELNSRFGLQWREDSTGAPQVAFVVDYNVIGLHPTPDSTNAGKTLRIFYYRSPAAFASDSDTPIFIDCLHDCLTWFCVSRGYAQIGDIPKSDWAMNRYLKMVRDFYSVATRFSDDLMRWRWSDQGNQSWR